MPCSDMGRGARESSVNPPGCGSWWESGTQRCSFVPRGWQQISPGRFTGRLEFTEFPSPNNPPSFSSRSFPPPSPKAPSRGLRERAFSGLAGCEVAGKAGAWQAGSRQMPLAAAWAPKWMEHFLPPLCDLLQHFVPLHYQAAQLKASPSQQVAATASPFFFLC